MLERRLALEAATGNSPTIPVIATVLGVACVAAVLRFYTRLRLVKRFYPEDWVMIATVILFIGYCISSIYLSDLVTQPTKTLPLDDALVALEMILVVESFYIWAVIALKISMGIFFIRISLDRTLRIITWISMLLSVIMGLALFLFNMLQCGVFENMLVYAAKKLSKQCVASHWVEVVSYIHSAITCLTDFVFVLLPILILRKSNMPLKEKIAAGTLMMLGSASGIAAIVRFFYIEDIAVPTETFFTTCAGITIWSALEPGVGIITGSVICLRPLVRRHSGIFSWTFGKKPIYDSATYVHELSQDTSALKQPHEEVIADPEDSKSISDDGGRQSPGWPLTAPPTAAAVPSNQPARDIEIVLSRNQSRSQRGGDGLPLGVFGIERPGPGRVSRGNHA